MIEAKVPMYDPELYELLKNTKDRKLVLDQWRYDHPTEIPNLRGASMIGWDLREANLSEAILNEAILVDANLDGADLRLATLDNATLGEGRFVTAVDIPGFGSKSIFLRLEDAYSEIKASLTEIESDADLELAYFGFLRILGFDDKITQQDGEGSITLKTFAATRLQGAVLTRASLKEAYLKGVRLEDANLAGANLENTNLQEAHLEGANLQFTNLKNADLRGINLERAILLSAYLDDTLLLGANLRGTYAPFAIVDGGTLLSDCLYDNNTDFSGVGLDSARIEGRLKAQLKRNIREIYWKNRYKQNPILNLVRPFWWVSDYGSRTWTIAAYFFGIALFFAFIYLIPTIPAPKTPILYAAWLNWSFTIDWPTYKYPFLVLQRGFTLVG